MPFYCFILLYFILLFFQTLFHFSYFTCVTFILFPPKLSSVTLLNKSMDFTTCKTILRGCKGGKFRYDSVIVFRTFKIVVEKIVAKRKGNWAQILLDFDFRTITWDLNRFQSILLLFSSLSLFSDHANYPCSVSTVLQQQYVTVLCDTFFVNLVTLKEWTPLQWRAVHNISRISSLSPTSKQSIMLYILKFVNMIPAGYEECWFQNCSSFCHSSTTAVLLFIEIYQVCDVVFISDLYVSFTCHSNNLYILRRTLNFSMKTVVF